MAFNTGVPVHDLLREAIEAEGFGDMKTAARIYQDLIESDPDFAPAYVNLGTIYFHQNRIKEASEFYRMATKVQPNYCLAWYNYANSLEELEQYYDAISAYKMAVKINPRHSDSQYNLALAYDRVNSTRNALRQWQAYIKIDSGQSKSAQYARNAIQRLLAVDPIQIASINENPVRVSSEPRPALKLVG